MWIQRSELRIETLIQLYHLVIEAKEEAAMGVGRDVLAGHQVKGVLYATEELFGMRGVQLYHMLL